MKTVKLLLGDPRHYTVGAHSNFVPINIGYIATFLKQEVKDIDLDIRLEVNPETIFATLDNWKPDVVGMSNYMWNASLTNVICEYAKKLNPNTLCILGGPEFPAGTGNIKNKWNKKAVEDDKEFLSEQEKIEPAETPVNQ